MKATMSINGVIVEFTEQDIGLDDLKPNADNSRSADETTANAQRIYNSMRPLVDRKHRQTAFRPDKFSVYAVPAGKAYVTLCGNGSIAALHLWSEADSDSFLEQFPGRRISVIVLGKLSAVEKLSIAADHSSGFAPMPLSVEQTALEFRRIMDRCKTDDVSAICKKLGYSTGKGKPYFHLQDAFRNNSELGQILWDGMVEKKTLIRSTHLPTIAAAWTSGKDNPECPSDRFGHDNILLWERVVNFRDYGTANGTQRTLSAAEKLAVEMSLLKESHERADAFRQVLVDVEISDAQLRALLDAIIIADAPGIPVLVGKIDKVLTKV